MKLNKIKVLSTLPKLKSNPYYLPAHQGDYFSALSLITHLNPDYSRFSNFTGYVCPVQKQTGNKIAYTFAKLICENSNLSLCNSVFLTNNRPGNKMIQRMTYNPAYTGTVKPGNYILVDDVITTGITLKALKTYIESSGSSVYAIYTLASSRSGGLFEPSKLQYKIYLNQFPQLADYFSAENLTIPQLLYINRFSSLYSYFDLLSQTYFSTGYF